MKALWLVVVVLILGGGAAAWWLLRDTEEPEAPPQVVEARRGDLAVEVTATGTVEPEFVVEIKAKASGTIKAVQVQAGDKVEQGALLLEIDPVLEQRKLTQAEAELTMAQAQRGSVNSRLEYARAQLAREEDLHKQGLVAKEAIEALRKELAVLGGDIQVSAAQLKRARAAHDEAKDRLAETKIYAPNAGTILERLANPGLVVTAGTTTGGQTLLTLANLERLFVRVLVDEADVTKIAAGQSARVTSDALPGVIFLGKVLRVAPQGRAESNVTVFEVVVELTGKGRQKLRPQLTANVFIRVGEVKEAVLIPRAALRQQSGRAVVYLEDGTQQRVKIGLADDQDAQILEGVEPGARLLVPGVKRAAPKSESRKGGSTVPGLGGAGGGRRGRL